MTEFPKNALPEIVSLAVWQAAVETKAPYALIAASALAACSLACQGHIMVLRPLAKRPFPVSLFFVTVAKSGERKTTVDSLFSVGAHGFLGLHEARVQEQKRLFTEQLKVWVTKDRALSRKLASATAKDLPTDEIEARIKTHLNSTPVRPIEPNLFFADSTPAAIKHALSNGWKSVCLQSSEGATILSSRASSELWMLDVLWDGGDLPVHRKESESFILKNARLTLSVMTQPGVMRDFIARGGERARDIGFLSRCLISYPESTQGSRFLDGSRSNIACLDTLNNRLKEIYLEYFKENGEVNSTPRILRLESSAEFVWREAYNSIEKLISPGSELETVSDFASKYSENSLRLAGIFHYMNGIQSEWIQAREMKDACQVMNFYIQEALRLFGPSGEMSKSYADARELERWFVDKRYTRGVNDYFAKNMVRNFGPPCIRDIKALDNALGTLMSEGKIFVDLSTPKAMIRVFFTLPQTPVMPTNTSYHPTSLDYMGLRRQ